MNATGNPNEVFNDNFNEVGFSRGVPFVIILLIAMNAMVTYFCSRALTSSSQTQRNFRDLQQSPYVAVEIGIEEITLQSYPTLRYSQAKKLDKYDVSSCCSICLCDYKNTDMLRLLPDCQHLFHLICIDPWLRVHPTCPVCRNSPISTLLSTPHTRYE